MIACSMLAAYRTTDQWVTCSSDVAATHQTHVLLSSHCSCLQSNHCPLYGFVYLWVNSCCVGVAICFLGNFIKQIQYQWPF